jgi:hypothetical protein
VGVKRPIILRHRYPTIEEIAEDAGMSKTELAKVRKAAARALGSRYCSACRSKRKCRAHE